MKQYLDLLQNILDNGIRQGNRTGIDTLTLPGAMLKFDLRDGFPAVTTKKLFFDGVKGELIGFLRGCTSAADFRALGCNVWNQNANEDGVDLQGNVVPNAWLRNPLRLGTDDLGRIYGAQWRDWTQLVEPGTDDMGNTVWQCQGIDQIAIALDTVRNNPQSRRIIVNAWNPAEINQAALPPCHTGFQLLPHVDSKVLHMSFNMRSWDVFLGGPFNIASYALLLELFSWWTGYTAGTLTVFASDAHIYVNHIDQVREQLSREPLPLPKLWIESLAGPAHIQTLPIDVLVASLDPTKLHLQDYQHHPAIRAEMAV